ncbi:DMT family transporter [Rhodobacter sp. NTK016B]|uniref:DMT family transporter n=1 Tax=Rhodobacter sp. NTK016B TaxID=2759676 RepID=UPI001A90AD75|nr:DMT family transporter [Rhodobacter sp. NTK016B]MBN8291279.1 DMT family transporter [Rhodobacter sp. NTK016B]
MSSPQSGGNASLKGPMLMVAAMGGFAIEDAFIKTLSASVPPGEVGLALGLGGALAFWIAMRRKGERFLDPRAIRGAALVRNVMEMCAAMCMITAVALVPLSVVSSILQAMPLAVTLGAAVVLKEAVGWRRWTAILVGFAGVLLILRPGTQGFDARALIPLAAVFFLSARDIATRKVDPSLTSMQLSAWGFFAVVPGGILLLFIRGETLVMPTALQALLMALTVAFGMAAYVMLVMSTRLGDIASTTPFRYARLVFAMMIGVIVFGERPDALTLIGSGVIVAAGLYTLMREIRLNRKPVPTTETATLP